MDMKDIHFPWLKLFVDYDGDGDISWIDTQPTPRSIPEPVECRDGFPVTIYRLYGKRVWALDLRQISEGQEPTQGMYYYDGLTDSENLPILLFRDQIDKIGGDYFTDVKYLGNGLHSKPVRSQQIQGKDKLRS